jgi:hypothetical protein
MNFKFVQVLWGCIACALVLMNCKPQNTIEKMELVTSDETGIEFVNQLSFNKDFNGFNYRNYYNGGGVAIGDINNDGLPDIYLTANMQKNKLYLNKGDFTFEDITQKSRTGGNGSWSTGVSMADINADGLLDIYVCNSGDVKMANKQNELFINNGDLTFTESARQYNLADTGFGTHASFFDYDKDGDLDAYILNNSYKPLAAFDQRQNERGRRDYLGGDKLMRNEGNIFIDVSQEAGIFGSEIGFGLGVAIGDINDDGWDDIFVSNDFFERDYLYINQKNGTFTEKLTDYFQSISLNSMGADMADVNNDGKNDLFVTDMLPRDDARIKSKTTFMDWNKAEFNKKFGYHNQFSRNVLQMSTPEGYKEIGRYSGLEATDWSWGALIFDINNDGFKDIFVANGIYQDLTDLDYINYISNEELMNGLVSENGFDYDKLSEQIPSSPIPNNFFKNENGQDFKEASSEFGLNLKGFSNGSAYGDLDNDGDLDLVVNNVNAPVSVYRNNTTGNSIGIRLKGETNTHGIGSKIRVRSVANEYYYEQQPVRGFQSSMDSKIVIGLHSEDPVDIEVLWPEGKISTLKNLKANQTVEIEESNAKSSSINTSELTENVVFEPIELVSIKHQKSTFVDFDRDRFLYHSRSTKRPKLALADWDSDGINDLFITGNKSESSKIVSLGGTYEVNEIDSKVEVTDAIFVDVDNDDDLDLLVSNGGVQANSDFVGLQDQLFINSGNALVKTVESPFGALIMNSSCVATADFDGDGDMDVFVGEGSKPLAYGLPSDGYLFENLGYGDFKDVTNTWLPELKGIGMVSDADFVDINGDGKQDLLVTGQFMGIHCFLNSGDKFMALDNGLQNLRGWWNTIYTEDLDQDGDLDIIAGNHGLNSTLRASLERPIALFVNDYDKNDFIDPVLTRYNENGEAVPYATRNELIEQIAPIKKTFPDFKSYEDATIDKMFSKEQITNSLELKTTHLASMLFLNDGNGSFEVKSLPVGAQLAPIFAISSGDYDHDGDTDILLGGNLYRAKPQAGRYDATDGIFLRNDGSANFYEDEGGFRASGEIRDIITTDSLVIVARNNDSVLFFKY